jgi:hypothetical protein
MAPSSAGSTGTLPAVRPYRPLPQEVLPECKTAAVAAVSKALTWAESDGAEAAARLGGGDHGRQLALAFRPLLRGEVASAMEPIYPQYGGLDDNRATASVMLVGRQLLLAEGASRPRAREFVVDVRLSRAGSRWAVTSARVGVPPRPARPDAAARELLTNGRIVLPEPARADVVSGGIGGEVTGLLNRLSSRWKLHVQVLRTGHPVNVFGTGRMSNHTRGRAVDIWAIDDTPLIGSPRSLWEPVVIEAARLGATEIGSPALPRGRAGLPPVFFANATHADHLHLGFEQSRR